MIKVSPRLAILGKSSNIVSNTLRYLCLILNNLRDTEGLTCNCKQKIYIHAHCTVQHRHKRVPEELKWSKNYNKIKRLHIEGKSNQAQEGKHCHREVKPGQTSTVKD